MTSFFTSLLLFIIFLFLCRFILCFVLWFIKGLRNTVHIHKSGADAQGGGFDLSALNNLLDADGDGSAMDDILGKFMR